VYLVGMHIY
jgi:hypothetical protein